jgi:hypothetical protein
MPLDKEGKPVLYKPWVNKTKSKSKYWVYVKADNKKGYKKIGFGHKDYSHFKDKIGYYKSKDHNDKKRRDRYRARASKIKDKDGKFTYLDKNTSNYWAYNKLW